MPRTWLYVPADRPDRCRKALDSDADGVVVDLEDSVAHVRKEQARSILADLTDAASNERLWVRVNDPRGPWGWDDLDAVAGLPHIAGIRVPKCEDPALVREIAERVGRPLHVLVESALGLRRAAELATAHPNVTLLSLGEADLAADLRVEPSALAWARGQIVVDSRSAGLASPVQSVWTDVRDLPGLRASTEDARRAGFFGRSVIHPSQVAVVNEVFTPQAAEVRAAGEVVEALAGATEAERGVAVVDGKFVDVAVAARARHVVALAEAYGTRCASS